MWIAVRYPARPLVTSPKWELCQPWVTTRVSPHEGQTQILSGLNLQKAKLTRVILYVKEVIPSKNIPV
jgi:hypothetical protein